VDQLPCNYNWSNQERGCDETTASLAIASPNFLNSLACWWKWCVCGQQHKNCEEECGIQLSHMIWSSSWNLSPKHPVSILLRVHVMNSCHSYYSKTLTKLEFEEMGGGRVD
jgi:hypothetical protein